jgi:hypothetical protein
VYVLSGNDALYMLVAIPRGKVTYVEDLLCSHCNSICYNQPLDL